MKQERKIQLELHFKYRQLIDRSGIDSRSTLPSFLFFPLPAEKKAIGSLLWKHEADYLAGVYAREQGEKTPQRLISSAKSWLCVAEGQRHANLPLVVTEDLTPISSVTASSFYLQHLKNAWDHEHPKDLLTEQDIILTVPASFDVIARDLTMEAARQAGFKEVTLLEEPISAFYSWLAENPDWRKKISVGDVILICDIGGGTTDFSLIIVEEKEGQLTLERIAVGEHILLGGDNMDLALARTVQTRLEASKGKKLEQWQFFSLAHSCRKAKELLLSDPDLEKTTVVVPKRGSRLMGKTLSSEVTRSDVEDTLLNGFFAPCAIQDHPQSTRRLGLRTLGLNYAQDSSILKHLAKFLCSSKNAIDRESVIAEQMKNRSFVHPTSILFNGGSLKARPFQVQIIDTINEWLKKEEGRPLQRLLLEDADLAVSLGAAYYGSVRKGKGIRVRSATTVPYYIGIESAMPAIPGMPALLNGICVVPVGMEEGSSLEIPDSEFGLLVGETADFRFFIGRDRNDELGTLVENAEEILEELSTLVVQLTTETEKEADHSLIPVKLRVHLSELGSLELWCDAVNGSRSWKLEFNLREE